MANLANDNKFRVVALAGAIMGAGAYEAAGAAIGCGMYATFDTGNGYGGINFGRGSVSNPAQFNNKNRHLIPQSNRAAGIQRHQISFR